VASVILVGTTLHHDCVSELGALSQLNAGVVVVLEELGQVTVGNCSFCGLVKVCRTDETTICRHAHGEVRAEVLVKGALSLNSLC
jgi:hypothetical protein